MELEAALAALSREERALVVYAATLAGRDAPRLLAGLPPKRAPLLTRAAELALALAPRDRLARLGQEAAKLAKKRPLELTALHPTRRVGLVARLGSARSSLPGGVPASAAAHPCVLAAVAALADKELPAPPSSDELALAPTAVRAFARASHEELERAARNLGASALRALLEASPPAVRDWLVSRLPEAWDDALATATPAPLEPLLAALAVAQYDAAERPA